MFHEDQFSIDSNTYNIISYAVQDLNFQFISDEQVLSASILYELFIMMGGVDEYFGP